MLQTWELARRLYATLPESADVVVLSDESGAQAVPAHRCVLAAASPAFRTFLAMSPPEQQHSYGSGAPRLPRVVISGVSSAALRGVVRFLYSGRLPLDAGGAVALLLASERLALEALRVAAEHELPRVLRDDNVCAVLASAAAHRAYSLVALAGAYALRHFDAIVETPQWLAVPRSLLGALLASDEVAAVSEVRVVQAALRWALANLALGRAALTSAAAELPPSAVLIHGDAAGAVEAAIAAYAAALRASGGGGAVDGGTPAAAALLPPLPAAAIPGVRALLDGVFPSLRLAHLPLALLRGGAVGSVVPSHLTLAALFEKLAIEAAHATATASGALFVPPLQSVPPQGGHPQPQQPHPQPHPQQREEGWAGLLARSPPSGVVPLLPLLPHALPAGATAQSSVRAYLSGAGAAPTSAPAPPAAEAAPQPRYFEPFAPSKAGGMLPPSLHTPFTLGGSIAPAAVPREAGVAAFYNVPRPLDVYGGGAGYPGATTNDSGSGSGTVRDAPLLFPTSLLGADLSPRGAGGGGGNALLPEDRAWAQRSGSQAAYDAYAATAAGAGGGGSGSRSGGSGSDATTRACKRRRYGNLCSDPSVAQALLAQIAHSPRAAAGSGSDGGADGSAAAGPASARGTDALPAVSVRFDVHPAQLNSVIVSNAGRSVCLVHTEPWFWHSSDAGSGGGGGSGGVGASRVPTLSLLPHARFLPAPRADAGFADDSAQPPPHAVFLPTLPAVALPAALGRSDWSGRGGAASPSSPPAPPHAPPPAVAGGDVRVLPPGSTLTLTVVCDDSRALFEFDPEGPAVAAHAAQWQAEAAFAAAAANAGVALGPLPLPPFDIALCLVTAAGAGGGGSDEPQVLWMLTNTGHVLARQPTQGELAAAAEAGAPSDLGPLRHLCAGLPWGVSSACTVSYHGASGSVGATVSNTRCGFAPRGGSGGGDDDDDAAVAESAASADAAAGLLPGSLNVGPRAGPAPFAVLPPALLDDPSAEGDAAAAPSVRTMHANHPCGTPGARIHAALCRLPLATAAAAARAVQFAVLVRGTGGVLLTLVTQGANADTG